MRDADKVLPSFGAGPEASRHTHPSHGLAPAPKVRRNVPPDLAYAIDLERLWWTLEFKGLPASTVEVLPRPRRLGLKVHGADGGSKGPLSVTAALKEIEMLRPTPRLMLHDPEMLQRSMVLERWLANDVAKSVVWCLLQPPMANGPYGFSDQFLTALILRALDVVAKVGATQAYLFGDRLSSADITAAAVLAPVVRKEGWGWANGLWPPLTNIAGRSALVRHPGAAWVRRIYDRHGVQAIATPSQTRNWVP